MKKNLIEILEQDFLGKNVEVAMKDGVTLGYSETKYKLAAVNLDCITLVSKPNGRMIVIPIGAITRISPRNS